MISLGKLMVITGLDIEGINSSHKDRLVSFICSEGCEIQVAESLVYEFMESVK